MLRCKGGLPNSYFLNESELSNNMRDTIVMVTDVISTDENACTLSALASEFVPRMKSITEIPKLETIQLNANAAPFVPSASISPPITVGTRKFSFYYCNARSVVNKLAELHDLLYSNAYDILCFTESWLNVKVTDGLLDPQALFNIYRSDRPNNSGGGVFVAIKKNIQSHSLIFETTDLDCVEVVVCSILLSNVCLTLICVYIAPNLSTEKFISSISYLSKLCSTDGQHIVLGDFNQPNIDWVNCSVPNNAKCQALFNFSIDSGFQQLVSTETRKNNILDLVFTNDPLLISELDVDEPFGSSDHFSIHFFIYINSAALDVLCCSNVEKLLWKKANWSEMADFYSCINWDDLFSVTRDANDCWDCFIKVIRSGIDKCVPKQKRNNKPKKVVSKLVRKLAAKKKRLWKIKKLHPCPKSNLKYKEIQSKYKIALSNDALDQERLILQSSDLGLFYKHVNARITHRTGIAPLIGNNGSLCVTDLDKANFLNLTFVSNGTIDNGILPRVANNDANCSLSTAYFSFEQVFTSCSKLKNNYSPGPDGLPPIIFKILARVLTRPLSMLFNLIVQYGQIPSTWKTANVTPIFKKGSSSNPNNYRPISITCVCSKLFESGIKDHLLDYMYTHKFVSDDQHGFLSKRSTCTNLLEALNDWTRNLDCKADTLVAYIDFAKAFDSVSIPKLIHKLSYLGVCGNVLSCIESFLTNRLQRVKVGSTYSSLRSVLSGVPQGSVLGPILFIVFINDIADKLPPEMRSKIFADDLKSYIKIDKPSDMIVFQSALDNLSLWATDWQLPIAGLKSYWMKLSNKNSKDEIPIFNIANDVLVESKQVKDLGIIFDSSLCFSNYITSIISKAKQRIYLLHKSFVTKDPITLIVAYKTYVLPIFDYCSQVWSPRHVTDINRIESVQRMFLKRLSGFEHFPYNTRLELAGLVRLELRRLHADLVYCYKIVHGLVRIATIIEFDKSNLTRGHSWKLKASRPRLDTRLHFYEYRVVKVWNKLKPETVSAHSIQAFKSNLFNEELSAFLIGN